MAVRATMDLLRGDPKWKVGRFRNLIVQDWRGKSGGDRERARDVFRFMTETAERSPDGAIGIAVVLEPDGGPPGPEVKEAIAAGLRAMGGRAQGLAYVVVAEGFVGAAVRASLAGLSMVAREPYPVKACKTPKEAATWLSGRLGSLSAGEIEMAISQLRDS
jgi:hypothetical protein